MLFGAIALLSWLTGWDFQIDQQPGAKKPRLDEQIRDLEWGQVNFLHTTDTHSWYLGHLNQRQYSLDWGDFISFVEHMRLQADLENRDLLVVDTGDKHDGNGLGDVSSLNGEYSSAIFARQQYDLLSIGNHELYNSTITEHEFTEIVPLFGDRYVCTNVEYVHGDGSTIPFGNRYRIWHSKNQGKKILGLGFLFDFQRDNERAKVTPISELVTLAWFKQLFSSFQEQDIDLVLIIGHIPVSHDWVEFQLLHKFVRSYFPHKPILYFGGHSHIRDFVQMDSTSFGLQSGRYCETVGWLSVQDLSSDCLQVDRKYIDFNTHSFIHHSNQSRAQFKTINGTKTTEDLNSISEELELNQVYGSVPQSYMMNSYPVTSSNSLLNFLLNKVLPKLVSEKGLVDDALESRIIIINTGSIRYDLYKGPFTKNSRYIVSPFQNKWKYIPSVPKDIALQIEQILNDEQYIILEVDLLRKNELKERFFTKLRGPNTKYEDLGTYLPNNDNYFEFRRKTYGYVTHDDFGIEGDDTVHRAFPYYREPNVVQSVEGDEDYMDVIYYDFIEPHIIFALDSLNYTTSKTHVYNSLSGEYNVGQLLQNYIQETWG